MKKLTLLIFLLLTTNVFSQATLYTQNGKSFQTTDGNHSSYNSDFYAAWIANNLGAGKTYPFDCCRGLGKWYLGIQLSCFCLEQLARSRKVE